MKKESIKHLELLIRLATRLDIPSLVSCSNGSAEEKERRGFGQPRSERAFGTIKNLEKAWDTLLQNEEIFVAESGEQVVGYIIVEVRSESIEIDDIAVSREFQGKGIGRKLVDLIEHRAYSESRKEVTLGTSKSASGIPWKSFSWWKSLGYVETGEEVHNSWTERFGGSEIRMKKQLLI